MKTTKIFLSIALLLLMSFPAFAQEKSDIHSVYTELLKDHIKNGMVKYKDLCEDERLGEYIEILSDTNPDNLKSEDAKLAFWINAYNAYTLKIICDNYPLESINDLHTGGQIIGHILGTTVWDKEFVIINNKKMTLNEIEHDIIRPVYNDARIHFALVCAAVSCPPLRDEAFTAEKLDEQLNDQGRKFLTNENKNRFNFENKTAYLSKILDWYEEDFGNNDKEVLRYLSQFLPEELSKKVQNNAENMEIDYLNYDWLLNEAE